MNIQPEFRRGEGRRSDQLPTSALPALQTSFALEGCATGPSALPLRRAVELCCAASLPEQPWLFPSLPEVRYTDRTDTQLCAVVAINSLRYVCRIFHCPFAMQETIPPGCMRNGMNDRKSFTITLLLVVVAGIVIGLFAFSVGRRDGINQATPMLNTTVSGKPVHKGPSPSDPQPEPDAEGGSIPSGGQASQLAPSGEPSPPRKDAPPMQGAANGDPPGTSLGSDQAQAGTTPPPSKDPSPR